MARSRTAAGPAAFQMPLLVAALAEFWRSLWHDLTHPYRPEQHYMRGPGPACRAKLTAVRQPRG